MLDRTEPTTITRCPMPVMVDERLSRRDALALLSHMNATMQESIRLSTFPFVFLPNQF